MRLCSDFPDSCRSRIAFLCGRGYGNGKLTKTELSWAEMTGPKGAGLRSTGEAGSIQPVASQEGRAIKHARGHLFRWSIQFSMLVCLLWANSTMPLSAEELQTDVNAADTMKQTLDQQVGKRAKVKLRSGQEFDGKVLKVGSNGVHLAELTGMEFYDAVIRLDAIEAVIIRVRK